MNYKKGFTLIEILVVVSIIGIITAVVMANLNAAKDKAIGIKSITELDQLKKAIELYRADNNKYPGEGDNVYYDTVPNNCVDINTDDGTCNLSSNQIGIEDFLKTTLLDKGYISAIPYYVAANDFTYTTALNSIPWACGGSKFSSYLVYFTSGRNLPMSKIDQECQGSVCWYCFGQ